MTSKTQGSTSRRRIIAGLRTSARELPVARELPRPQSDSVRELVARVIARLGASEGADDRARAPRPGSRGGDERLSRHAEDLLTSLREGKLSDAADACTEIADWADIQNAPRTAAWFIEAAVALKPDDPDKANRAGHFASRRADFAQARAFFQWAIRAGTHAEDWDAVARAWTGLGTVERRTGDRDDAAAAHMQTLAIARRHGLEHREGEGFHNLAVIAFEQGKPHDGILFARRALDAYEDNRVGIAILANDLAWYWMDTERAYGRALAVFERVLHMVDKPGHRVILLGNIARSSAGKGDAEAFSRARAALDGLLAEAHHAEGHAQGLLETARGAALLGDIPLARREAKRALAAATTRQEGPMVDEISHFLETLGRAGHRESPTGDRLTSEALEQRKDDLAFELLLALR